MAENGNGNRKISLPRWIVELVVIVLISGMGYMVRDLHARVEEHDRQIVRSETRLEAIQKDVSDIKALLIQPPR